MEELNKNLYINYKGQTIQTYVVFQTYLENMCNDYYDEHDFQFEHIGLAEKMSYVFKTEGLYYDFGYRRDIDYCYDINVKANSVKHYNGKDIRFDYDYIDNFISAYNRIIEAVIHHLKDGGKYYIDEEQINELKLQTKENFVDKPEDRIDLKVNLQDAQEIIDINTGTCFEDHGFTILINGIIEKRDYNAFAISVYATIYNFLQRSSHISKSSYLKRYEAETGVELDFAKVYRYEILLLTLIRYGAFESNKILINQQNLNTTTLKIALADINHYCDIISNLCKQGSVQLEVSDLSNGLTCSLSHDNQSFCNVMLYDKTESDSEAFNHNFWFAENLIYNVDMTAHKNIMKELLMDFFGYNDFRPGQLQAIVHSLNTQRRTMCIMPTGAGKSLVYYMVALLQPCPSIIISPTNILAKDQCRNLSESYSIDDYCIISDALKGSLHLNNKFIYTLPSAFQSRKLIYDIIEYNKNNQISTIILDEVHTLCNWSHDFRPDYLMLCANLFRFADNCKYMGFTATVTL